MSIGNPTGEYNDDCLLTIKIAYYPTESQEVYSKSGHRYLNLDFVLGKNKITFFWYKVNIDHVQERMFVNHFF